MPCANNCKQKGCETCGSNCKRCACACDGIDPALAVNRKRGRQRKSPSRGGREKRRSSVAATNLINAQVTDEAKPTTYGSTNGPFPAAESPKDIFDTLKIDSSIYTDICRLYKQCQYNQTMLAAIRADFSHWFLEFLTMCYL